MDLFCMNNFKSAISEGLIDLLDEAQASAPRNAIVGAYHNVKAAQEKRARQEVICLPQHQIM